MKDNVLTIILAIGLILMSLFIIYQPTSRQNINSVLPNEDVITITGTYEDEITPDIAEILISVSSTDKDGQKAQIDNAKVISVIIDQTKKIGIDNKDIETLNYQIELVREWNHITGQYLETGLKVTNSIKIKVKDFTKISSILHFSQLSSTAGSTTAEVENLRFTLSEDKEREIKKELLSKAAENAREKAEAITDSLDVSIKKVKTISEQMNYNYPRYEIAKSDYAMSESVSSVPPTPINPKSTTMSATVNVVFEIE